MIKNKCKFCGDIPCYEEHCEFSKEYLEAHRKKTPWMNWDMERLKKFDNMVRETRQNYLDKNKEK